MYIGIKGGQKAGNYGRIKGLFRYYMTLKGLFRHSGRSFQGLWLAKCIKIKNILIFFYIYKSLIFQ